MKQITAAEFKAAVELDPAWANKLTEPVEITGYCNMRKTGITHLSPLLHFIGRDATGNAANFYACPHLEIAQGTFAGCVLFDKSGIEKIQGLVVTAANNEQTAASFNSCARLKVAEGTFHGYANFANSGVERIGELTITETRWCNAASFSGCENLKIAEGTFPGWVDFSNSNIERIGKLEIATPTGIAADFNGCDNLATIPGKYLGAEYEMEDYVRQKNLSRIAAGKAASTAQKIQPDLEI